MFLGVPLHLPLSPAVHLQMLAIKEQKITKSLWEK